MKQTTVQQERSWLQVKNIIIFLKKETENYINIKNGYTYYKCFSSKEKLYVFLADTNG